MANEDVFWLSDMTHLWIVADHENKDFVVRRYAGKALVGYESFKTFNEMSHHLLVTYDYDASDLI